MWHWTPLRCKSGEKEEGKSLRRKVRPLSLKLSVVGLAPSACMMEILKR